MISQGHYTIVDLFDGPQGPKGDTGSQGPQGPKGDTGVGVSEVVEYYLATSSSSGVNTGTSGWTTDIQNISATKKYLWNYEQVTYTNGSTSTTNPIIIGVYGDKGDTGSTGPSGKSISTITEYYLASASYSGVTTSTSGWTTTMQTTDTTKRYLWNYEVIKFTDNTTTIINPVIIGTHGTTGPQGPQGIQGLQGLQGPQGDQGIQGPKGIDGKSSYTHIAYATGVKGENFSTSHFESATYIGMYVDNNPNDSTSYGVYNWSLIKGADGSQGIQGPKGTDGKTPYFHTAWATSADGSTGFSTTVSTDRTYIGTYTDFTSADSTDPTKYNWVLIKGDKGDKGATGDRGPQGPVGTGISTITEYYLATSSSSGVTSSTSGWSTTMQTMTTTNKFLWNYEKVTFTDGSSSDTIPVIIGVYGNTGATGSTGRSITNITEYYLATSSESGVTRSTSGWSTTMQTTSTSKKYLWNYEVVTWSSAPTTTYVEPIIIGVHGDTGPKGDSGPQGLQGLQGPKGDQGIQGPKGVDGKSSYTHIAYATGTSGQNFSTSHFANATYIGMYVDNVATDSTNYTSYNWSLIKGADGAQGIQGPKGTDGKTPYFHTAWATNSTGTTGFSTTVSTGKTYIGTYTDFTSADSTDPSKYNWVLIKGEKGDTGPQGVQGPKGADGQTLYTWVKYADTPTSGMSDSPTGKTYIGLAYNKTTATESSTYGDYSWSLIKGTDGARGPAGANGTTTYTWIKYADDENGNGMSDSPDGKRYLGLAYNKTTATESSNASNYTWSPLYDNVVVGGRNLIRNSEAIRRVAGTNQYAYEVVFESFKPNTTYTFSTLATKEAGTATEFVAYVYDFYGDTGGSTMVRLPLDTGERVSFTFTTPNNSTTYDLLLYAGINGSTAGNTILFEELMLEQGNVATDWTPAPEDVQDEIDKKPDKARLIAEINASGETVKIKGSKIDITGQVTFNSLDSGVKSDINAGKTAESNAKDYTRQLRGIGIRYIRDWLKGNTSNTGNNWVEIKAMAGSVNRASKRPVTSNFGTSPTMPIERVTDDNTNSTVYTNGQHGTYQYVQIDLGAIYDDIDYVHVWHYYSDGRTYYNTKTEVSSDGVNWVTLFDSMLEGTYPETSAGRIYYVDTKRFVEGVPTGGTNILSDSLLMRYITSNANTERVADVHPRLKVSYNGNGTYFAVQQHTQDRNMRYDQGKNYIVSMEVRGNVSNLNYTYMMRMDGANRSFPNQDISLSTTDWIRVAYQMEASWTTDTGYILIGSTDAGTSKWFEIRKVMIEEGNRVSTYSPNPLDTANVVDSWKYGNTTEINGGSIRTRSINADKISVNSLSALSANLGKVTSGELYSPKIRSTENLTGTGAYFDLDPFAVSGNNYAVGTYSTNSASTEVAQLSSGNVIAKYTNNLNGVAAQIQMHSGSGASYISHSSGSNSSDITLNSNGVRIDKLGINGQTSNDSYKLHVGGDSYFDGWMRINGSRGPYFQTHGGGWYMTDSDWIRSYNNKGILTSGEVRGGVINGTNDVRLNGTSILSDGSNTNGRYIKFADGTLICHSQQTFMGVAITSGLGSLYYAPGSYTNLNPFPHAFSETPRVNVSASSSTANTIWVGFTNGPSTTSPPGINIIRHVSQTLNITVQYIAVGRWK